MSNPSLLCVPYRFKTSKLYSQIPDSGLGDFTVTRSASNSATRVNAAGLIETVADNVPRLDYPLGGITAGCPALLVEPSAVNLCLQSAAFATSPWSLTTATSPNTTATTDPFGQTNADLFTATANYGKTQQPVTRTASGTHTVSCFVKGVAGVASVGSLIYNRGVGFTITSGGVVTVNTPVGYNQGATIGVENYGNGWYRIFAVLTHFTTPGTDGILIDSSVSGNSFYIFGAQVEAGSIATSYIPTTTGPVTRGAETYTATVGPFNSGSAYIAISDNDTGIQTPGTHLNGPLDVVGAASLGLYLSRTLNASFRNRLWTQASTNVFDTTVSDLRLAFTWNGSNVNVFQNGTKVVTNFAYALTGVNIFRFGPVEARNRITAFAVYNSVLTDAQLQSLTQ